MTPLRGKLPGQANVPRENTELSAASPQNADPLKRLIGVIDLKDGQAVHAIAGQRDRYRPRRTFVFPCGRRVPVDGDPECLLEQYVKAGLSEIYVADLDAIVGKATACNPDADCDTVSDTDSVQWERIDHLLGRVPPGCRCLIDFGINERLWGRSADRFAALMRRATGLHLVVATECCGRNELLDRIAERLPIDRIVVSFDYQHGHWMSATTSESQWIETCIRNQIRTVIALDLAAVGTGDIDRAMATCRGVRQRLPAVNMIGGGGVRGMRDVAALIRAGADRVLVASMFSDAA